MDIKRIIRDALVLCLITLIAGGALGLTHEVTDPIIKGVRQEAANKTYREVFPEAAEFVHTDELTAYVNEYGGSLSDLGYGNVTVDDCMEARDANHNPIGYVVTASSKEGYGGTVQISAGISTDDRVTGLGFLTINETPGLGMKAKDDEFRSQFVGKDASEMLTLIKVGTAGDDEIQAISGATFTSNAVTGALNAAVYFVNSIL